MIKNVYDTGASIKALTKVLKGYKPASLKFAFLSYKRNNDNVQFGYHGDYVGFCCPKNFEIGFGLDHNNFFRDIRHICVADPKKLMKFEK